MNWVNKLKKQEDRDSYSNYIGIRHEIKILIHAIRENNEHSDYIREFAIKNAWNRYNSARKNVIAIKFNLKK